MSAMFMPKRFARLRLELNEPCRLERLQDITPQDIQREGLGEGCNYMNLTLAFIDEWDKLARNFWKRMMTEGPPMRTSRWCCKVIKEAGGTGRVKLLGMRRKESVSRKDYCIIQKHKKYPTTTWMLPIVDWDNNEVWEYIRLRELPYCCLYDEGYTRLGCVLCPFESASTTKKNIVRFPKIAYAWRKAFDRYFQIRIDRGTPLRWETAQDFWDWWISRK